MNGMGDSAEIQRMLAGAMKGSASLQGMMPSAQDAGGAPPQNMDPADYCFNQAHGSLLKLSAELKQYKDDVASNQVAQLAVKVKDIQLTRRRDMAKEVERTGSNARSAAAGLNAMGVPGGM